MFQKKQFSQLIKTVPSTKIVFNLVSLKLLRSLEEESCNLITKILILIMKFICKHKSSEVNNKTETQILVDICISLIAYIYSLSSIIDFN